jgi:hypothetical protein
VFTCFTGFTSEKSEDRETGFASKACVAGEATTVLGKLLGSLAKQVNPANKLGTYLLASPVLQVKKVKTRKPASQAKPVLLATLESLWKGI